MGVQHANYVSEAPKIQMRSVELSRHAIDRALDMNVTGEEIRAAIETPSSAYISRKHDAWLFENGRIGVGLRRHWDDYRRWAVVTVIWATAEGWIADAMVAGMPEGRGLGKTLERIAAERRG